MPTRNDDPVRGARGNARRIALALVAVLIAAWAGWSWLGRGTPGKTPALFETSGEAVGTRYSVTIVQRGHALKPSNLRNIVDTALQRADWLLSATDPNSETSRFNAFASTAPFRISTETAEAIACALKIGERTAGAFDLTIAPVLAAHAAAKANSTELSAAQLDALREHVGYEKLTLDASAPTLAKSDAAVAIDLRGLLAGFAADLLARALDGRALDSYRIEIGGQSRCKGRDPAGKSWAAGLDTGGPARSGALGGTSLGTALASQGPIIDARTGRPITHALESVAVLHADAMWAQAYANAILVLGPDDGLLMAKLLKLPALLTVRGAGGKMEERVTPGFDERFGLSAAAK